MHRSTTPNQRKAACAEREPPPDRQLVCEFTLPCPLSLKNILSFVQADKEQEDMKTMEARGVN